MIKTEFVTYMPDKSQMVQDTLYVSKEFRVAIHLCACNKCGLETVTPLDDKAGWILIEDNEKVSLSPSIGNFQFPCKSHYFLTNSEIVWC